MDSNKKARFEFTEKDTTPLGSLKLLLRSKPDSCTLVTYLKANDMTLDDNAHVTFHVVPCFAVLCLKRNITPHHMHVTFVE